LAQTAIPAIHTDLLFGNRVVATRGVAIQTMHTTHIQGMCIPGMRNNVRVMPRRLVLRVTVGKISTSITTPQNLIAIILVQTGTLPTLTGNMDPSFASKEDIQWGLTAITVTPTELSYGKTVVVTRLVVLVVDGHTTH